MSHQFFQDQKQMVNNNNIPMQSGNQTAPAAPIIHIRDDSSSQMDALFSVLDKPPPSNSLKHRNLPETFFIQPKIGRHSRDNSLDCTLNAFPIGDGTPQPGGQVGGLKVMHVKSASLPAQFPQTMSLAPQPGDLGKTDHGGQMDAMIGGNTADLWQQQQKLQQQSAKLKQPGVSRSGQGHMRTNHVSVHQGQDLGRLPEGWDQGMTPEGEVYFINHIDKTTTWFDPRLPESAQRALQSQKQKLLQDQLIKQQQQTAAVNQGVANQDFIQSELRRLRQEGEKLRQQMEQVTQQEQMWAQLLSSKAAGPQAKPATVAAGLSGVDAFLGQMPIKQEYHARQSSNDSGLGINIGTQGYSLPRTPDDCLSNVDDMDVAIESGRSMKKLTLNSGGMVTTPAQHSMVGGNMFMHAGGGAMIQGAGPVLPVNQMSLDVIGGGLDVYSDELLPSLQEPGVYADVLNDLVDQKMENMQWL